MKRLEWAGFIAGMVMLGACTRGTISIGDLNGVGVVVEGTRLGVDDRDGTVRIYNERASLTVRGGRLWRDHADLGEVRRGDHVRLTQDGRV